MKLHSTALELKITDCIIYRLLISFITNLAQAAMPSMTKQKQLLNLFFRWISQIPLLVTWKAFFFKIYIFVTDYHYKKRLCYIMDKVKSFIVLGNLSNLSDIHTAIALCQPSFVVKRCRLSVVRYQFYIFNIFYPKN